MIFPDHAVEGTQLDLGPPCTFGEHSDILVKANDNVHKNVQGTPVYEKGRKPAPDEGCPRYVS